MALAAPYADKEKVLAPAIMSALVRVASSKSPLRLRSDAPEPTLMLETESPFCVATATVIPKPDTPSTRTLSTRLMVDRVSMRKTLALLPMLDTVMAASAAMSTVEPNLTAPAPRVVALAMALIEPALAENDSSEFSLLLYLFLTAWLVALIRMDSASTWAPAPTLTSAVPATTLVTKAPLPANKPTAMLKAWASKSWSR